MLNVKNRQVLALATLVSVSFVATATYYLMPESEEKSKLIKATFLVSTLMYFIDDYYNKNLDNQPFFIENQQDNQAEAEDVRRAYQMP